MTICAGLFALGAGLSFVLLPRRRSAVVVSPDDRRARRADLRADPTHP